MLPTRDCRSGCATCTRLSLHGAQGNQRAVRRRQGSAAQPSPRCWNERRRGCRWCLPTACPMALTWRRPRSCRSLPLQDLLSHHACVSLDADVDVAQHQYVHAHLWLQMLLRKATADIDDKLRHALSVRRSETTPSKRALCSSRASRPATSTATGAEEPVLNMGIDDLVC